MARLTNAGTLRNYARFCRGLAGFLRRPMSADRAAAYVRARLLGRERLFLPWLNRFVFQQRRSPYAGLLEASGIGLAAVRRWVLAEGVDAALRRLRDAGVYLTYEEFCGTVPTRRDGGTFRFTPADFENRHLAECCAVATGATRNAGARTKFDLDLLTDWSAHYALMLAENRVERVPHAAWFASLPGGAGISTILVAAKVGLPVERWFAPISARGAAAALHRTATHAICRLGQSAGAVTPAPCHTPLEQAARVAHWAARRSPCAIHTYASSALAIVRAAQREGFDLAGTRFFVTGEPLTRAKTEAIEAAGARAVAMYGFTEAGFLGCGCTCSAGTDRIHLFTDAFAAIEGPLGEDSAPGPLLFTALLPCTPKVLLNVAVGDRGRLRSASCNCQFARLGLRQTIERIHSVGRLTVHGMTYEQTRVVPVVEEALPRAFGGEAGDYQLVEREKPGGQSELLLVVAPRVGPVAERALIECLLSALSAAPAGHRMMVDLWRQARAVRVVRSRPFATMRGKVLPVYTMTHRAAITSASRPEG